MMPVSTKIFSKGSFPAVLDGLLGKAYRRNGGLYKDFHHPKMEFEEIPEGNVYFVSFDDLIHSRQQHNKKIGRMARCDQVINLCESDATWWMYHQNAAFTTQDLRFGLVLKDGRDCFQFLKLYWDFEELEEVGSFI